MRGVSNYGIVWVRTQFVELLMSGACSLFGLVLDYFIGDVVDGHGFDGDGFAGVKLEGTNDEKT